MDRTIIKADKDFDGKISFDEFKNVRFMLLANKTNYEMKGSSLQLKHSSLFSIAFSLLTILL